MVLALFHWGLYLVPYFFHTTSGEALSGLSQHWIFTVGDWLVRGIAVTCWSSASYWRMVFITLLCFSGMFRLAACTCFWLSFHLFCDTKPQTEQQVQQHYCLLLMSPKNDVTTVSTPLTTTISFVPKKPNAVEKRRYCTKLCRVESSRAQLVPCINHISSITIQPIIIHLLEWL